MTSVFDKWENKAWPYKYQATLHVFSLAGGIPSDPNVAEGWIKTKLGFESEELIQRAVAEVMAERGVDAETAAKEISAQKHLNGFKRASNGQLYIEGRQLKAAIKEGASVAAAAGKIKKLGWAGNAKKGVLSFLAEHVQVDEDILYIYDNNTEDQVLQPTGIVQRFVHTHRGSGIQYEEYVEDARLLATVRSDMELTEEEWAMIWLTAGQQGLGASRSQGFGKYEVIGWERL